MNIAMFMPTSSMPRILNMPIPRELTTNILTPDPFY
jgi:hypothetical protein